MLILKKLQKILRRKQSLATQSWLEVRQGDCFSLPWRKERFGGAEGVRVELSLDQDFPSWQLLNFWTRSFFAVGSVLCTLGSGADSSFYLPMIVIVISSLKVY